VIKKKKGRGGARKNAGRKRVPISLHDIIVIGSMCERVQTEDAKRAARAEYEKRPRTAQIRRVQKEVRKHRITDPRMIDALWEGATLSSRPDHSGQPPQEARAVRSINKMGARVVRLKIRRVATREEVCNRVSDGLLRSGRLRMTPRRVREVWHQYRAFLAISQAESVPSE
jgi:hypothetical protein